MAGCTDPDALCSWAQFKSHFADVTSLCSLAFCKAAGSAASSVPLHGLLLAAAVAALSLAP